MAKLQIDDFKTGMIVTVFKGAKKAEQIGNILSLLGTQTIIRENDHCKGDVLRIEAIDLPFIVTSNVNHPVLGSNSWDIREVEFMELSNKYIEAKLEKK